jgi:hypothetical protein
VHDVRLPRASECAMNIGANEHSRF